MWREEGEKRERERDWQINFVEEFESLKEEEYSSYDSKSMEKQIKEKERSYYDSKKEKGAKAR